MRTATFWLCLLALVASVLGQCAQDIECGNHPYAVCRGGVNDCRNTIRGLGVNEATQEVFYAQICRTNTKFNNITFKKVSADGGSPVTIVGQQQVSEPVNPEEVFDVVGDNLYFSTQAASPGSHLTTLSLSTLSQSDSIDTGAYFRGAIEFDTVNKKTYVCNLAVGETEGSYSIDSFNGILGQDAGATKTTLYSLALTEACTAVRVSGSNLFITVTDVTEGRTATTKFYKGSTDGSAELEVLFNSANVVTDFDVTSDKIFYATARGVFASSFSGQDAKRISWSGATGIRVAGERVFWNSGVAIVSANLDCSGVKQLNSVVGTCSCRPGFSSTACHACAGGQVQWLEGVPTCVTIKSDGNPATCNYDSECANSPYARCEGESCVCREGFSGTQCNVCAGTVSWKAGVPSCQ